MVSKDKSLLSLNPHDITNHDELVEFINKCYILKPDEIFINENKWKYLVRSVLCGKNIMMTGPAGCGKTMVAFSLSKALGRNSHIFNMGQTQDPKSYLIGNTHASKEKGTYFNESSFVRAIREENSIIVLDEFTRSHPEAWNLLMPVLDYNQRYLRLDEQEESIDIPVARGVSFISTANIGSEYTATRVLDRAIVDRFAIVEVDVLTKDQEAKLLKLKFPTLDDAIIIAIASVAHDTRVAVLQNNPAISSIISTRMSVETAELCVDGFTLEQAADVMIYPHYATENEERNSIKLMMQKYLTLPSVNKTKLSGPTMFGQEDFDKLSQ